MLGCDLSPGSIAPSESRSIYTAPGVSSVLAERAAGFFGAPSLGGGRTIFADQLSARLTAGETLFIIDVRDSGSYGSGHIPGAVNIPLGVLFQQENLRKIPTDGTPIITMCVTGHTGSMAMAGLAALGYNAYTLRFGMMAWSASTAMKVWSASQVPQSVIGLGGAISTEATPATATYNPKELAIPPGIYSLIAARAARFYSAPLSGGTRTIFADQLSARLATGEKLFIIDVRDQVSYGNGHIPGAVNIPLAVLFLPESLAMIPTDGTPVVTVCVTGHTGSMAMSVLGALGYNAYTLRFGMMGWSNSTAMKVWSASQVPQSIIGLGGAVNTGLKP